jgi:hypothetical protein
MPGRENQSRKGRKETYEVVQNVGRGYLIKRYIEENGYKVAIICINNKILLMGLIKTGNVRQFVDP